MYIGNYSDKFKLKATMSLDDFNDNYEALDQIVTIHKNKDETKILHHQ